MCRAKSLHRAVEVLLSISMLAVGIYAQNNPVHALSRVEASVREEHQGPGSTLRAIVESGRIENLRWPDVSDCRPHVEALYRSSGYAPVWLHDGAPTPQALEMISMLEQADSKGLLAEDYDSSRWPERLARLQATHTPSDEAQFDAALTVSTMRYVSALRMGRINPRHFEFGRDIGPKELDLPTLVENQLVKGADLKSALASIEPTFSVYRRLQTALAKYMLLAKEDDGEKLPEPHGTLLITGTEYAGVPRLTRLLHALGDLPESAETAAGSRIVTKPLLLALMRFQERQGFYADGDLTPDTLAELNVPMSVHVEQIRLALERYRWLRYDFNQPPIIVNIPGFRLVALDEEGKVGLSMSVDVGQEFTPTPVLEEKIEYVVFRPYWDVPLDIQEDEIVPNIKKEPNYLSQSHFEVISQDGALVTDGKVSPEVLHEIHSGKFRVRQKPGPDNSLGLVKFIFPNRESVYLHDVATWNDDFVNPDRDVSHGCVHLENPAALAAWVLRDKPEWTLDRVRQAMQGGKDNTKVLLTKPLPVLIVYMTAGVRENGDVHFYRDIYGYDAELQKALASGYPYPQ
jgi:murein L,D-transpeptidase YcbB/YkuD